MKRMLCLLLCLLMLPIAIRPAKAAEDETIVRVLLSTNEASPSRIPAETKSGRQSESRV